MAEMAQHDLVVHFRAAQKGPSATDATLTIGKYEFHIHSGVVTCQSPFFAAALEGKFKEGSSRDLHLTDEDPWMVARLIQFVYTGTYELTQVDDERSGTTYESLSIHEIINKFSKLDAFEDDRAKDRDRSKLDIVITMYNLADKYVVGGLMDVVIKNFVWIRQDFRSQTAESLSTILDGICTIQMARHREFHEEVARFISLHPPLIQMPKLQERCTNDPQLTFLIAKECAREADMWKERTYAVEQDLCRRIDGLTWTDFVTNWSRNPEGWELN